LAELYALECRELREIAKIGEALRTDDDKMTEGVSARERLRIELRKINVKSVQ